jgi:hypothetical protein
VNVATTVDLALEDLASNKRVDKEGRAATGATGRTRRRKALIQVWQAATPIWTGGSPCQGGFDGTDINGVALLHQQFATPG